MLFFFASHRRLYPWKRFNDTNSDFTQTFKKIILKKKGVQILNTNPETNLLSELTLCDNFLCTHVPILLEWSFFFFCIHNSILKTLKWAKNGVIYFSFDDFMFSEKGKSQRIPENAAIGEKDKTHAPSI